MVLVRVKFHMYRLENWKLILIVSVFNRYFKAIKKGHNFSFWNTSRLKQNIINICLPYKATKNIQKTKTIVIIIPI